MAKVKIFLDEGETLQDAEDSLFKAMSHHNSGDAHSNQTFQDPAMDSVADKMIATHSKIYQEMMQEIFEVLDQEYAKKW